MMISFACPSCKQTLEVEDRGAGLIVPCPTCSEKVTIPWKVEPAVVSPIASSVVYNSPSRKSDDIPPVIHAGLLCLLIYISIAFIGLLLFHSELRAQIEALHRAFDINGAVSLQAALQNPFTMQMQILPVVFWLGNAFETAAFICAIIAMAQNHVNKGIALLVGSSLAFALFYFGINHIAHQALQEELAAFNQGVSEMQQQLQRQMQQMFGGRPSR
jgi:DNA-directed RNA polymerase subunit RPC12/RpoP